ncbi:MAG TPA: RNA polymerase factor sigma-54 [Myxococcales bacterium]|nr:RNA polymerase factor sigma-54 [Myxococcales bacterium]
MALELKQNLRLSQQLVMTPQLQQAIKLLQLSRLELVELIRTEMEQNPLLEEPAEGAEAELEEAPAELTATLNESIEASELLPEKPPDRENDAKQQADGDVARSDIDWEQYLDNYQTQHTAPSGGGGSSEDLPNYQDTLTRAEGLSEHLMEQLRMAGLTRDEERIGVLIIGNLNRDGYLVVDPEAEPSVPAVGEDVEAPAVLAEPSGEDARAAAEKALKAATKALAAARAARGEPDPLVSIALESGASAACAEKVLHIIQRFEPIGCGARDLRECLLVQAHWFLTEGEGKDDPDADLLPAIISSHLKNVETKKYQAIAKDLHVSLEEVVAAIKLLSRLDPKPGRSYASDEPQYITPDVYIHKVGDQYVTVLNDDGLSKLRISQHYRQALKNGAGNGKAKEYIQEKLRSAVWLIRSIHQRQRTIVKVADSIIKFQREFLDKGIAYLKPLILRDVAEDIGMHESTVSRVTTNKYVHTPQGIYELKFFFNSSIARTNGDDIASEAVKNQIKQIVASEPGDKPYSDQKIVEILRSQNVDIARRTVAKYREVLGILPSSKRKRFF